MEHMERVLAGCKDTVAAEEPAKEAGREIAEPEDIDLQASYSDVGLRQESEEEEKPSRDKAGGLQEVEPGAATAKEVADGKDARRAAMTARITAKRAAVTAANVAELARRKMVNAQMGKVCFKEKQDCIDKNDSGDCVIKGSNC